MNHVEHNGILHIRNGGTPLQKDVLLMACVSSNQVPIGGRKRGREELSDCPDVKRCCRAEAAPGQWGPSTQGVSMDATSVLPGSMCSHAFFCTHKYAASPGI